VKPLVRGRKVDLVEFCGNWYPLRTSGAGSRSTVAEPSARRVVVSGLGGAMAGFGVGHMP
jgi:hypothetical protein